MSYCSDFRCSLW